MITRRLKSVSITVIGLVGVTALIVPLALLAFAVDAVRFTLHRVPWMAIRLLAFLWVYLAAETFGLLALLAIWVASGFGARAAWLQERTWSFQQLWAAVLFGAARGLMGLKLGVEGDGEVAPGPVIVLVRHASILDNLLPSVLVARAHRIHLRYVLKRELLSDPCLDVAGKRLPNYFVRRGTGEAVERENIRRLAEGLTSRDGILLYPEGTRFTPERRERLLAAVAERDAERAQRLGRVENLLPPKVGGFLALLEGAPDADVVVMAHAGLDGLRLISDIWQGALVGRTIAVRFERTARSEIPEDPAARVQWLDDAWLRADGWVAGRLAAGARS